MGNNVKKKTNNTKTNLEMIIDVRESFKTMVDAMIKLRQIAEECKPEGYQKVKTINK